MKEFRHQHGEYPAEAFKVRELIDIAMGEPDKNVVHFKMLQNVLYILASHLRILERKVDIKNLRDEETADEDTTYNIEDILKPKHIAKRRDKSTKYEKEGSSSRVEDISSDGYVSSKESFESHESDYSGTTATSKTRDDNIKKEIKAKDAGDKDEENSHGENKRPKAKYKERDDAKMNRRELMDEDKTSIKEYKDKKTQDKEKDVKEKERVKDEVYEKSNAEMTGEDKENIIIREKKAQSVKSKVGDTERNKQKEKLEDERNIEEYQENIKKHGSATDGDNKRSDVEKIVDYKVKDSIQGHEKGQREESKDEDDAIIKEKEKKEHETSVEEYKDKKTQDKKGEIEEQSSAKDEHKKSDAEKTAGYKGKDSIQEEEKEQREKSNVVHDESIKAKNRIVEEDRSIEQFKDTIRKIEKSERKFSDGQGRQRRRSSGSIEVVTQREFRRLQRQVDELRARAQPPPEPWLPDNEDLLRGDVSLADVMEAMQLQYRVQAAEKAVARLAELIPELFSGGAFPGLVEDQGKTRDADKSAAAELATDGVLPRLSEEGSSRAHLDLPASSGAMSGHGQGQGLASEAHLADWQAPTLADSIMGATLSEDWRKILSDAPLETQSIKPTWGDFWSRSGDWKKTRCVSPEEMQQMLQAMRKDFMSHVKQLTGKANHHASIAAEACKRVEDKMGIALNLNNQLTALHNTVMVYAEQLQGYSGGSINAQMDGYQLQLNVINEKLQEGLQVVDSVANKTDTLEILDLREQCDILTRDLEDTMDNHQKLSNNHALLRGELLGLADVVEELQELKADREELEDALNDKADMSQLQLLVERETMEHVKSELEIRMRMCHDKFQAQNSVWMQVIQEINETTMHKANVADVQAMRDQLQYEIHQLNKKAVWAAKKLGDPKAAIISRRLMKEASCCACRQPAMMAECACAQGPPRLPAVRPRPLGAEHEECYSEGTALPKLSTYKDVTQRPHICQRWCGGSHTKFSVAVARERCPPFDVGRTAYMGSSRGTDNKVYHRVVDPCQPRVECDVVESVPGEIEGFCLCADSTDQGKGPTIVTGQKTQVYYRAADPSRPCVECQVENIPGEIEGYCLCSKSSDQGNGPARAADPSQPCVECQVENIPGEIEGYCLCSKSSDQGKGPTRAADPSRPCVECQVENIPGEIEGFCLCSKSSDQGKGPTRAADPSRPCVECQVENIRGEIEGYCLCSKSSDQGEGPTLVTGQEAHRATVGHEAGLRRRS